MGVMRGANVRRLNPKSEPIRLQILYCNSLEPQSLEASQPTPTKHCTVHMLWEAKTCWRCTKFWRHEGGILTCHSDEWKHLWSSSSRPIKSIQWQGHAWHRQKRPTQTNKKVASRLSNYYRFSALHSNRAATNPAGTKAASRACMHRCYCSN